jgi:hypothetical protein
LTESLTGSQLVGAVIMIDDSAYKGVVFFATYPKKEEDKAKEY